MTVVVTDMLDVGRGGFRVRLAPADEVAPLLGKKISRFSDDAGRTTEYALYTGFKVQLTLQIDKELR